MFNAVAFPSEYAIGGAEFAGGGAIRSVPL